MAEAATALGIVSSGIQICQGLLSYYDSWKDYKITISETHGSIDDLRQTLKLVETSLKRPGLDQARVSRVQTCLLNCNGGLDKLQKKLQKLQTYENPKGIRQRAWAEVQRSVYPFKESTLAKLREVVADLRERLSLALQELQLDIGITSHITLTQVAVHTKDIAADARNLLTIQQANQFRKIIDWLSPPDPWTNHATARELHEPLTGEWLLQSERYKRWKAGSLRHLWMYGKAGCGKTILSSSAIEDVRVHCKSAKNSGLAIFYFSFSDSRKQSYASLLCSLVAQLGEREPTRSMLQQEYDKPNRSLPGVAALEEILVSTFRQYDEVFLTLDALDECPETEDARRNMLVGIERLCERAANLRVLATSRELRDVQECMESLEAELVQISTRPVDADIRKYVASELSRDRKLNRIGQEMKTLIMGTFAQKADGMFRWAYCQLQELKKLKSTRPSYIKAALHDLPVTLDATYERMLKGLDRTCRYDALVLLRWLAYARSPPRLAELAEAILIDPRGEGCINTDDRGGDWTDTLDILAGLVTLQKMDGDFQEVNNYDDGNGEDEDGRYSVGKDLESSQRIDGQTVVRLAHFSVKEYLESERIVQSGANDFHLKPARVHEFLAQSCLMYLVHYSSSDEKTSTEDDLAAFPLLKYSARSWYYHSSLQQSLETRRAVCLLSTEAIKSDWLVVHRPDRIWEDPFTEREDTGSALYYASFTSLEAVVCVLLAAGEDVNAQGGWYGNALQAASSGGHEKVVQMLIDGGADVNAQGGEYGNALQAASSGGHEKVVQMLMDGGVDVNAQGGEYGNALHAASLGGHEKVVQILMDAGAC